MSDPMGGEIPVGDEQESQGATVRLTERERAVVLAALRYFQNDLDGTKDADSAEQIEKRRAIRTEILDGEPAGLDEIDELCELLG